MTRFIDQLEGRTLFTATPAVLLTDRAALATDAQATIAALRNIIPAARADLATVRADLVALPNKGTNLPLFNHLVAHARRGVAIVSADCGRLIATTNRAMNKIFADEIRLQHHPTNAIFQAKLQADIAAAGPVFVAQAAQFSADLTALGTTLDADVAILTAANPTATKLNADLQNVDADGTAGMNNVQATLAQGYVDLSKLITDLTA